MIRFYLIAKDPVIAFDTEDAVAAYFSESMHNRDQGLYLIVKGVALQPRMQLALLPIGGEVATPPTPRAKKQIPEPADGIKATVMEFFKPGITASKRKFTAETSMAVDTASNAIDWLAQNGALTLAGKSYTRTAVAPQAKEQA